MSLAARIVYAAVALANVALFLFFHGDVNNILIALLLVMFIANQRSVDLWRGSALTWREVAEHWRETSAMWRKAAEDHQDAP